ncbi:MAG TPA: AAA family ATPase [Thermomicrobiales bacterium]|nr:AAA family ATPase [Thermomicrobiales bacterium]
MGATTVSDTAGVAAPAGGVDLPPLVRALLRPAAYPHPAGDLRLHETHISWVVLAGAYAYKVKKPVRFAFLDFSTVDRRRAACAAELALNRRLCPDVYLDVVDVVARGGAHYVGGPGAPVEPALRMRRLPDAGMLPALLARGVADADLARRLGRRLAAFHATALTGPGVDEWGTPAAVRRNWEDNLAELAPFVGRTLAAGDLLALGAYGERVLLGRDALLRRRAAAGRVRDGHGDLHAANVCVEGRRLHLFDCLEFSPRYRCADVAADVAFLAMDLDHRGRADLAAAFVDAYVRASGDRELPALLDFYRCYRALVRAKVASLRLDGLAPAAAAGLAEEARAYVALARAYAERPARPALVVVMGPPASGKTSVAAALAARLGLVHLASDVVRKELVGLGPAARRVEPFGQGLYAPALTRRTYAALRRRAARALRGGQSVVLDATFGARAERAAVARLAARLGVRPVVFVCGADDATLRARLAAREGDAATASDARLAHWPALRAAYSAPAEWPAAIPLDTTRPLADTVAPALAALRARAEAERAGAAPPG